MKDDLPKPSRKLRTSKPQRSKQSLHEMDLTGRTFKDFHLLRRLDRGGMAEVYLAKSVSTDHLRAVKVLRSDLAENTSYVQRFHAEASAATKLNHENIVETIAVGQLDNIHFIAQEYIDGINLRQTLVKQRSLHWEQVIDILKQIVAALGHAAEVGIVHRDIKPENILITTSGTVKLTDFGLAHDLASDKALSITPEGVTLGTPLYMSPEQVKGETIDHRSDFYSLGVTAYHMLSGTPPFQGENAYSLALQHVQGKAVPLETILTDAPQSVCRTIHKMMARNVEHRYQAASEILADLTITHENPHPLTEPEIETSAPDKQTRTPRPPRQPKDSTTSEKTTGHKKALVVLSIICIATLGGLLGWNSREKSPFPVTKTPGSAVARKPDADSQFFHATQLQNEASWLAVIDYFPDSEAHVYRAKQNLAYKYLMTDRTNKAQQLFEELSSVSRTDDRIFVFGQTGKIIVYCIQGEFQQSDSLTGYLFTRKSLIEPRLLPLLQQSLLINAQHLDKPMEPRWQEFFENRSSTNDQKEESIR